MTNRLRFSLSLLLLASACGGAQRAPYSNASPASESGAFPGQGYSEDPREHISELFDEIGDMREGRSVSREPRADDVRLHSDAPAPQSNESESVGATARTATTRPPSICESTCTVKTNICHNAAKICQLSTELKDTEHADWADEKCDSGKASCTEAETQCDECDG